MLPVKHNIRRYFPGQRPHPGQPASTKETDQYNQSLSGNVGSKILRVGRLTSAHSTAELDLLRYILHPGTEKLVMASEAGERNSTSFNIRYHSFFDPHPIELLVTFGLDRPPLFPPTRRDQYPNILSVRVVKYPPNISVLSAEEKNRLLVCFASFEIMRPLTSVNQYHVEELKDAEEVEDTEEEQDTEEAQDTEEVQDTQEVEDTDEAQDTQEVEDTDEVQDTEEVEDTDEVQDMEEVEDTDEVQDMEDTDTDSDQSLSLSDNSISKPKSVRADYTLRVQENIDLINNLPEVATIQQKSEIKQFLHHLESKNITWSALKPANEQDKRPAKLETFINESARKKQIRRQTRSSLNRVFQLELQGYLTKKPKVIEHQTLLNSLPKTLLRSYRSHINAFLNLLESKNTRWSQLISEEQNKIRDTKIEEYVNSAIANREVHTSLRSALNRGLGLSLKAPGLNRKTHPALPEHKKVIENLPGNMHKAHPAAIARFLYYLEQQNRSLTALLPQDSHNKRPELLEKLINQSIKDKQAPATIRSAMNKLLGLTMVSEADSKRLLKRKR